jgi:hypothetical protein
MPRMRMTMRPRKPRYIPVQLRIPLSYRSITPRNPLKALTIQRYTIRNTLRIQQERLFIQIRNIVAGLIVVCIKRHADLAAE